MKIKTSILILFMTVTSLAFAIEVKTKDFVFRLINDSKEYEILDYIGNDEEVMIPPVYQGIPVTSIGPEAFNYFKFQSLKSVFIPCSIKHIATQALSSGSLEKIEVDQNNESFKTINGVLFDKSAQILLRYPANRFAFEYMIPDQVEEISAHAFEWCVNLFSILIPDSVKTIGDSAFSFCINITKITIPPQTTFIGENTFASCTHLERAVFLNSLKIIPDGIFSGCVSLKYVFIPDSVQRIGEHAFGFCSSLQSIALPGSLLHIENYAFHNTGLKNIVFPQDILSIGDKAFSHSEKLNKIVFASSNPPDIGTDWIEAIDDTFLIIIPEDSLNEYLNNEQLQNYSQQIIASVGPTQIWPLGVYFQPWLYSGEPPALTSARLGIRGLNFNPSAPSTAFILGQIGFLHRKTNEDDQNALYGLYGFGVGAEIGWLYDRFLSRNSITSTIIFSYNGMEDIDYGTDNKQHLSLYTDIAVNNIRALSYLGPLTGIYSELSYELLPEISNGSISDISHCFNFEFGGMFLIIQSPLGSLYWTVRSSTYFLLNGMYDFNGDVGHYMQNYQHVGLFSRLYNPEKPNFLYEGLSSKINLEIRYQVPLFTHHLRTELFTYFDPEYPSPYPGFGVGLNLYGPFTRVASWLFTFGYDFVHQSIFGGLRIVPKDTKLDWWRTIP